MDWTAAYPKKPGFYWACLLSSKITILKRTSKKSIWGFGGDSLAANDVAFWGKAPEAYDVWQSHQPNQEGWYAVKYDDKTTGFVFVAAGDRIHCYDFNIPSEIDIQLIVSWNGPLVIPAPPPKNTV